MFHRLLPWQLTNVLFIVVWLEDQENERNPVSHAEYINADFWLALRATVAEYYAYTVEWKAWGQGVLHSEHKSKEKNLVTVQYITDLRYTLCVCTVWVCQSRVCVCMFVIHVCVHKCVCVLKSVCAIHVCVVCVCVCHVCLCVCRVHSCVHKISNYCFTPFLSAFCHIP